MSTHKYPTIELDKANLKISEEHVFEKSDVKNDGVQTNLRTTGCKTEDCTDLGEISSVSGIKLEREEKVRKFDMEFVVSLRQILINTILCICLSECVWQMSLFELKYGLLYFYNFQFNGLD